ncbi:hypothetical protein EV360DRAFT_90030 [Lentinula raphanica]|nr:hypothetical protein EV360DRAFT_90030 [Lentinula raphanica]
MRSVKTWQGENMYPNQDRPDLGGNPPPHSGYASSRSGGGADFFERLQRETMTVNIWPPSPKPPARDFKKSKRQSLISSDTDSEEDERRRREKKGHRKRKEQRKEEKRERKRKRSRSRRRSDDEEDYRHPDEHVVPHFVMTMTTGSLKNAGSGAMLAHPVPIPEQSQPTNPNHYVGSDQDDNFDGPPPAPRAKAKWYFEVAEGRAREESSY